MTKTRVCSLLWKDAGAGFVEELGARPRLCLGQCLSSRSISRGSFRVVLSGTKERSRITVRYLPRVCRGAVGCGTDRTLEVVQRETKAPTRLYLDPFIRSILQSMQNVDTDF